MAAKGLAPPSARLGVVGELVIAGVPMADVGTDHAQLPSWLLSTGKVPGAIGIDVAEGPLAAAATSASAVAGLELRQGDGLTPLRPGEVATVVIAGMGGARIQRIVDAGIPAGVERLVLAPNTEWAGVRAWIAARRWRLQDERMVEDRGKSYVVLAVAPVAAAAVSWSAEDLELGPILRRRREPVWRRWVEREVARLRKAAAASQGQGEDPQREDVLRRLAIFEAALDPEA